MVYRRSYAVRLPTAGMAVAFVVFFELKVVIQSVWRIVRVAFAEVVLRLPER